MIISGDITLIQAGDYATFVDAGRRMRDGETQQFDVVVLATGYQDQQEGIRPMLGDEIAFTTAG